jgi:predicted MFS family arabinose efflux permease
MAANELLLIVYGGWMEGTFALSLTALGLATGVIGAAEIVGELATGVAVDRLGKRPVIIVTGLLAALMYAAIPLAGSSLTLALGSLFLIFFLFEMTVVGSIPLMTELAPDARSVVMSVTLAAGGIGRAVGALLGLGIWQRGGFAALGLTSAVTMLVAVVILALWVREGHEPVAELAPAAGVLDGDD